jgi:hypothetical protein
MRILPCLIASLTLLGSLGCGNGDTPGESTPSPAATVPAAPATPTEVATETPVPPTPPAEATPGPVNGRLSLSAPAPCDEAFTLKGSGFEAKEVAVLRLVQFEDPEPVAAVQTNADGGFEVELVPSDLGDCNPGWTYGFIAGPSGATPNTPESWPVAVYDVEQLGAFDLTPASIPCGVGPHSVQLSGSGFPASAPVHVFQGGSGPLADNFASLGDFDADAAGQLDVEIELLGGPCDPDAVPGTAAIYGVVEGLAARWKAVYDIVP